MINSQAARTPIRKVRFRCVAKDDHLFTRQTLILLNVVSGVGVTRVVAHHLEACHLSNKRLTFGARRKADVVRQ